MPKTELTDEEFKRRWPAWFYGPNGEAKVFEHPADVPDGWTNDPYKGRKDAKPDDKAEKTSLEKLEEEFGAITRDDIVASLKERGVEFKANAKTEYLASLLLKALANDDGAGAD